MARRPSAWAASPVVPLPEKRSTTVPPGCVAHATICSEERARLLRRETGALGDGDVTNRRDVRPQRVDAPLAAPGAVAVFDEEVLDVDLAARGAENPPFLLELRDRRVGVVAARRARERAPFVVPTDGAGVDRLEARGRTERHVPLSVDDDGVERSSELMAGCLAPEVGGTAPDDLVHERIAAEDLVEQDTHEIRSAPIEMHPNRAARGEEARHRVEPRREKFEVVADAGSAPSVAVGACSDDASVSRAVEARFVRVVGLGRERWIEVDEVDMAGEPFGGERRGDVE